jgi:hypothetical protein
MRGAFPLGSLLQKMRHAPISVAGTVTQPHFYPFGRQVADRGAVLRRAWKRPHGLERTRAAIAVTGEKSADKFSLVCTAHQCDKFAAVAVANLDHTS